MKCILEGDKCVSKRKTSCLDYIPGSDEDYCYYITLEDSAKACLFYNNNCFETYKTCEDYKGKEKEICEAIIPTYEKDHSRYLDEENKCVFDDENKKCKTEVRYCDEAFTFQNGYIKFCDGILTRDENKICLNYKNECIETYGECEDYNDNVEKDKCEAIIPDAYYLVKCVYDDENKKCISKNLECSSFEIEPIKYICELLGNEMNKKCVYSDGFCLENNENDSDVEIDSSYISDYISDKRYINIDNIDNGNNNKKNNTSNSFQRIDVSIILIIILNIIF